MSKISSLITGTDYDLADALFNSTSAETGEGAVSNNVTRIEAVARADSDSGTVTVDFGGETVSGDNLQAVEVDATVSVKEGDKVLVTVANGKPIVTGVLGWGDNVSAEIEANKKAIQDTVDAVNADIADVKAKADELAGELDSANQKIEQVATDVDGVKTTATNAAEKAEQSLTVATEAKQTATEIKTTADKAYEDAESALKQSSEALQTADGLSAKVTEAAETANSAYSAATSAEQTATGLKQTVEENYLTKDAAAGEYASISRVASVEQSVEGVTTTITELQGDVEEQSTLIRQSGNGVEVARKVDGAYTSTKTLQSDTGYSILSSDDTELAVFGANKVELGKNDVSAEIEFCGGTAAVGTVKQLHEIWDTSDYDYDTYLKALYQDGAVNSLVGLQSKDEDTGSEALHSVNLEYGGSADPVPAISSVLRCDNAYGLVLLTIVNGKPTLTINAGNEGESTKYKIISLSDLCQGLWWYPVGAVYISYVSTSPASLFGGTWVQLTGRFLRFANDTNTGGADSHTLSTNEMPSHNHGTNVRIQWYNNAGYGIAANWTTSNLRVDAEAIYTTSTGGNAAHNNMPAYQDLYAWRRTA